MKKIKNIFQPKLKLIKGTRLTSALFIGTSIALAAGILWAANMYYNIDTGKVMIEEPQRVTGLLEAASGLAVSGGNLTATTTQITVETGSPALTVTQQGTGAIFQATSTASMTAAAFKITNLGSGASLVIEDSDTDTTPFVIDASGNVGVGTSTPSSNLAVAGNIMSSGNLTLYGSATSTLGQIEVSAFKLTTNPTSGYVLTANSAGYGTWQAPPSGVWTESGSYIYPTNWLNRDVAIATTTARYDLDVWGNAAFGTTTDYNTPLLLINSSLQKVGIATSTPSAELAVNGNLMIDGDLTFVGNQTIIGSGTLTINPSGDLYLQSTSNYIDDSGNLVLAGYASTTKVISPELEYQGDIKIDANSAGNTTITVINEGGGVANLTVEGDIMVTGGKVTLATGETIDAETSDHIIITAGGSQVLDIVAGGIEISGQATTSDTFYVSSGGAKITGTVTVSSGNLTVQGDILPQAAGAGYTLGDSTTYWDNLYVATTTIGSSASYLTIEPTRIAAPGALTVYLSAAGTLTLQPQSNSDVKIVLGGTGQLKIGSSSQFYIDASGHATTSGSIYAAEGFRSGSNDATIRKSGEQIVRGVVPIFGFDLPARCNTSCDAGTYATISRVIENDDDLFPNPYPGTTRKYRFSIRYADATTTATTRTTWQIATSSDPTYVDSFTLPPTASTDLSKGFATTTNPVSLPANDDWFLRVTTGGSGGYTLQVYEILLIGLDEVQ